jgi:hypothetical protein
MSRVDTLSATSFSVSDAGAGADGYGGGGCLFDFGGLVRNPYRS